MQEYPTAYTSAEAVAEAVYAAATDGRDKLRYPAGADSVMLAELRQSFHRGSGNTAMNSSAQF